MHTKPYSRHAREGVSYQATGDINLFRHFFHAGRELDVLKISLHSKHVAPRVGGLVYLWQRSWHLRTEGPCYLRNLLVVAVGRTFHGLPYIS